MHTYSEAMPHQEADWRQFDRAVNELGKMLKVMPCLGTETLSLYVFALRAINGDIRCRRRLAILAKTCRGGCGSAKTLECMERLRSLAALMRDSYSEISTQMEPLTQIRFRPIKAWYRHSHSEWDELAETLAVSASPEIHTALRGLADAV